MSEIVLPYNWSPRDYQKPVWNFLENGGKRAISVWHRRAGKDLTAINYCATAAFQRVGLYLHMLPFYKQGRKIVWDGMDKTGKKFLSAFPDELIESKHEQDMKLKLVNGSIYQVVGTDNIDSLVGSNPVGLILSEYSLHDPHAFDYLRPILTENEGWAWFIYTPRGRNHGHKLLERGLKNPKWFVEVLGVDKTNAVKLEDIEEDRLMGMAEETIQQEYYCSFDAPLVGAYYSKQMSTALEQGRIGQFPYDPMLPVNTYWDLGVDDATCIWFAQIYPDKIKIVDYYENSGEGLLHYIKVLNQKPYNYDEHFAPHDIQVRDFTTGRSRLETARDHGIRFRVATKMDVADGIEAVRNILPRCYFNDIKETELGIEALRQYQKQYDEKRKTYMDRPLHDWASHAADAFRVLAQCQRRPSKKKLSDLPTKAVTEYDMI